MGRKCAFEAMTKPGHALESKFKRPSMTGEYDISSQKGLSESGDEGPRESWITAAARESMKFTWSEDTGGNGGVPERAQAQNRPLRHQTAPSASAERNATREESVGEREAGTHNDKLTRLVEELMAKIGRVERMHSRQEEKAQHSLSPQGAHSPPASWPQPPRQPQSDSSVPMFGNHGNLGDTWRGEEEMPKSTEHMTPPEKRFRVEGERCGDVGDDDDDFFRRRSKKASPGLQKLAKNTRGHLGAKIYHGDPNPVVFNAWCESLRNTYDAYDIDDDEEQVRAASWYLGGKAERWWDGLVSARTYRQLRNVKQLFQALRKEFQPADALEEGARKWGNLRQVGDAGEYMNGVMELHYTHPMGSQAEYAFAYQGLKEELKGVIKRALLDQNREWCTLSELKALAKSAEVEKGMTLTSSKRKQPPLQHREGMGGWQRDRRPPVINVGAMGVTQASPATRKCGVCNMQGHWTRDCRHKKPTGCWRCGGPHLIPHCTAPYPGSRREQGGKQGGKQEEEEQSRQ